IGGRCKNSNVFSLAVLMVEDLTCFRFGVGRIEFRYKQEREFLLPLFVLCSGLVWAYLTW
ncbi:MAG: hypothetical protein PHN78_08930, partial [Dehalococcoidales bacterium]|nr:hypothetical protein [Dehalococcoidales bacterium]